MFLLGFNVLTEFTYVGRSARFLSWPIPSFACIKTARACFMDEWEMKRVSANAAISWRRKCCKASLLPISLSRHNHPLQRSHSAHTGGLVIFRQRLMMSAKRWSRSLLLCFPRRSFNGVAAEMFFIATWPPQLCAQGCVRATWLSCIGFASNGVSLKSSECCCRRSPAMMQAIDRFTDARPNHS